MAIGGSPAEIRREAARVRTWADSLEGTGDRVRTGHGVEWVGPAGDRFRERLADHAADVGTSRQEELDLARALDHLADTLEERQAAIRRAQEIVEDALDGARGVLGRLGDLASDLLSDGEQAARSAARDLVRTLASTPPPGSPDWLNIAQRVRR